ncbi:MAG: PRC-barrel domain-containing protein [Fibrobacterota bacterium]
MLRLIKEITGYHIRGINGDIGKVKDLIFDERNTAIRYLVADVGKFILEKDVLISTVSLNEPEWSSKTVPVNLNTEQIREAPGIDSHQTVSRQHEIEIHEVYGWPIYWAVPGADDEFYARQGLNPEVVVKDEKAEEAEQKETFLRSFNEITGYSVKSGDEAVGEVKDMVMDDITWKIRYFVIEAGKFLNKRDFIVSPDWIDSYDWGESSVSVNVDSEKIKECPEFNPSEPINRKYEKILYDYYGRPKYWEHYKNQ